ncbi:sigma-70 family RNA polymerase sigma factor [Candidatus Nomurabacteria bacterium]|nr:sigma-70 family RNA polymerase sigma factor [Candidatus Nomurabacteria bacterium]
MENLRLGDNKEPKKEILSYDKTAPLTPAQSKLVEGGYEQVRISASRMFNAMKNDHTTFRFDDFLSWGTEGLINAAQRFDLSKDVQFPTYAERRIRGAILDGLREHNSQNFMRRSHLEFLQARTEAVRLANEKLKRDPTEKEIADQMNLSLEEYLRGLKKYPIGVGVVSLTDTPNDEGDIESGRFLDKIYQEINPYGSEENKRLTIELLNRFLGELGLNEMERQVINMYFEQGLPLKEIGKIFKVTESRISQIKNKVIKELRKLFKSEGYSVVHSNKKFISNSSLKQS